MYVHCKMCSYVISHERKRFCKFEIAAARLAHWEASKKSGAIDTVNGSGLVPHDPYDGRVAAGQSAEHTSDGLRECLLFNFGQTMSRFERSKVKDRKVVRRCPNCKLWPRLVVHRRNVVWPFFYVIYAVFNFYVECPMEECISG